MGIPYVYGYAYVVESYSKKAHFGPRIDKRFLATSLILQEGGSSGRISFLWENFKI